MKKLFDAVTVSVVALFVLTAAASAQVPGTIYRKDGGQATGNIRYLKSSRTYEIQVGQVTVQVPEKDVVRINMQKPKEIDQAAAFMAKKQYSSAIPLLKRVESMYKDLQWDKTALRGLAECYFESGMASEGIKMVEEAMNSGGESLSPTIVQKYWDELIKNKDYAKLERSIESVIATGARSVAAVAQIKRGDMLKEKGQLREAAVDGYLRTVVFYQEEKEAREEAVYKAMKVFQDLGQQTYADKMRKILMSDYPNGTWAKKAQAGA